MTDSKPQHRFSANPWQTNALLLLLGSAMLLLCRQLVGEHDLITISFSRIAGWSVIVYVFAIWLILTRPVNRVTFPIILTVAITCQLVLLFPRPYLSTDVYRYAWDGVVQHAHISPYRYVPGDPALAFLRAPNQNLFDNINRRDYARTIYPPGAQLLFYLVTFINPGVTFMKMVMVLFEGLTMYALVELFRELNFRREQSLILGWCPLLFWEIGSAGHLDSAAMALVTLALLARYRKQSIATGVYIGIAILIKLYPLVLLPTLFRRREYKMPTTVLVLIVFGYACYASVGMRVFGSFDGYAKEEGLKSGDRYFLLELVRRIPGLHALPAFVFLIFTTAVFAALTLWCWNTCCNPQQSPGTIAQIRVFQLPAEAGFLVQAFVIAFTLMILFSPHYPWYVVWLVPFLALVPNLAACMYICGFYYLCTTKLAVSLDPSQPLLNKILYGSVLVAFIVDLALRRLSARTTYKQVRNSSFRV